MQVRNIFGGRKLFSALSALLFSACLSQAALADPQLENIDTYIDGTIEAQMALQDIPAVTVSVVKDGQLLFSRGYGFADRAEGRRVDPATSLFRIGSTSKLFTWIAVMQLYEQGQLDLDADVNEYLNFRIPNTFAEPITMRHILGHTAGFEDGGLGYLIKLYPNMGVDLETAMEKFLPKRLNPPGRVSSYSNYATALAGLVVQNISGVPFNEYIQQNIFDPLGMAYSTFDEPLPAHLQPYMTTGYQRENGVFEPMPFEVINSFGPAGAVSSSAHDMARFMIANLNDGELDGNRILRPETSQLMHSRLFTGDDRLHGMAYGFYEKDYNGHRLVGHGGDTFQFHTDMLIDKEQNIGIFVSYMIVGSNQARSAFVRQIYDHYFPQELETITPPSNFAERAGQYAGSYIFWRRNESTIEKASALFGGGIQVIPTEDNTLLVTGPFAVRQFVEVGEHLFRQVDGPELIAFSNTGGGRGIDTMYFGSLPFMGMQRQPMMRNMFFKTILPFIAFALFLHTFISWFYRRKVYKTQSAASRRLINQTLFMGLANWFFVICLSLVLMSYGMALYREIPFIFKAILVIPLIAVIFTATSVYAYVKRWQEGSASIASQIYYALVIGSGLYLVLFYSYWNILGWQLKG